jgi:hypothetical protein
MSRSVHSECCQRGKGERGFALLLVFVMAAVIALMLYRQMPRAAFESERDKEQLLIDRGAQYQRAIQLYFVTFKRYPSSLEDLENTNDHRFLRRRYIDPYTGKSEWRLIHTNGMTLTDSKVQPPPNPNGNGTGNGNGSGNGPGNGTGNTTGNFGNGAGSSLTQTTSSTSSASGASATPPAVNATVAARASDRTLPDNQSYNQSTSNSNPTAAGAYNQPAQYNPPNYNDPAQFPPISLFPNGYNATTQPGQPGQPGNGSQTTPNQPGLNQPGLNQPGLNQPGQPGFNQPGSFQPGQPTLPAGLASPPSLPPGTQPPRFNQPGFDQSGLNQSGLNQPGLGQPGLGQPMNPPGTVPPLPGGMATSPDGTQQGQFPGQQFPVQQAFLPSPPVQQPPVQQAPMQPLPGLPTPGGQGQQFNPGNPGAPGGVNPGLNIINQLLTTPRQPPAGLAAATDTQTTVGGGIAGVASKFTGPTIKSYGGRTDYSEWEFVYQLPQQTGIPQNGQNQNGQNQNGQQQGFQPFSGPGGASMPTGPPPGPAPPPPPGGFPAIPSLPH